MRYKLATIMAWPVLNPHYCLRANRLTRWYFKHMIFPLAGI